MFVTNKAKSHLNFVKALFIFWDVTLWEILRIESQGQRVWPYLWLMQMSHFPVGLHACITQWPRGKRPAPVPLTSIDKILCLGFYSSSPLQNAKSRCLSYFPGYQWERLPCLPQVPILMSVPSVLCRLPEQIHPREPPLSQAPLRQAEAGGAHGCSQQAPGCGQPGCRRVVGKVRLSPDHCHPARGLLWGLPKFSHFK